MRVHLAVIAGVVCAGGAARADGKADAEKKFDEAKQLMKAGLTAEACDAFAASDALDPQFGTRYNLALCDQELGKTASAFVLFTELAASDTNAKRKADSEKRAAVLEPLVPRLRVSAPAGVTVTRDGIDMTAQLGTDAPVNPGKVHLRASADGSLPWEQDVELKKGEEVTVDVPPLEPAPVVVEKPAQKAQARRRGRGQRLAGYASLGVGVVATGVGLGFGAKARSTWGAVETLCGEDLICDPPDYDAGHAKAVDARAAGNLSTIFVGVGVAAIAAGVVLVLTAPHGTVEVVPSAGDGAVGVTFAGAF